MNYIRKTTSQIRTWWELALQTRESVDNLKRYIGKRRVLDQWFARLKRDAMKLVDQKDIVLDLAYGSADPTMKSNGRSELSVPTTGVYQSALRIFKGPNSRVSLTNEAYSTKVDWESGEDSCKVYLGINDEGRVGKLMHAKGRYTPVVPDIHKSVVQEHYDLHKRLSKQRRGGCVFEDGCSQDITNRSKTLRYPEVRGLRFIQKSRTFTNRDANAALTIARLHALEVTRGVRPAVFSR